MKKTLTLLILAAVVASCGKDDTPINVTGVSLDKTELALSVGDVETIIATVTPDNAADKAVTWTSSVPGVATVDNTGKTTALTSGTTTITATASDKSATCIVTVAEPVVAVSGVTINKTTLTLGVGENETLTATVLPDNATDKTVSWTSSVPSVATVDNTGKVNAIAVGSAIITATSQDGGKTSTCMVTITAVYAIGDYYPDDTNPVGIVFRAKTSTISGLVVSLDEAERVWSSEAVPTGATSTTNGLTNRTAVQSITDWQTKYPAFNWIYLKNNSNLTGPWYLPTSQELVTLYAVFNGSSSTTANNTARTAFNAKLTSAGGTAINGVDGPNDWYWSSRDTAAGGNAYEFSFFDGEQYVTANKLNSFLIRAVLAF